MTPRCQFIGHIPDVQVVTLEFCYQHAQYFHSMGWIARSNEQDNNEQHDRKSQMRPVPVSFLASFVCLLEQNCSKWVSYEQRYASVVMFKSRNNCAIASRVLPLALDLLALASSNLPAWVPIESGTTITGTGTCLNFRAHNIHFSSV